LETNVVLGTPSRAAAPFGPPTTPPVSQRACRMCELSASSIVTGADAFGGPRDFPGYCHGPPDVGAREPALKGCACCATTPGGCCCGPEYPSHERDCRDRPIPMSYPGLPTIDWDEDLLIDRITSGGCERSKSTKVLARPTVTKVFQRQPRRKSVWACCKDGFSQNRFTRNSGAGAFEIAGPKSIHSYSTSA